MKLKTVREMALLCIPIVIIVVAVAREKLVPPSVRQAVREAEEGKLVVVDLRAYMVAPADAAYGNRGTVRPMITLGFNEAWIERRKGVRMRLLNPRLFNDKGKEWPAPLSVQVGGDPYGTFMSKVSETEKTLYGVKENYITTKWLDFKMPPIPLEDGDIWYRGQLQLDGTKAVNVKLLVRPAWLLKPSRKMRLKSISYQRKKVGKYDDHWVQAKLSLAASEKVQTQSLWPGLLVPGVFWPGQGGVAKDEKFPPYLFSHWDETVVETAGSKPKVVWDGKWTQDEFSNGRNSFINRDGDEVVVTFQIPVTSKKLFKPIFSGTLFLEGDGFLKVRFPMPVKN